MFREKCVTTMSPKFKQSYEITGVGGANDSLERGTPQSLSPKDIGTPP